MFAQTTFKEGEMTIVSQQGHNHCKCLAHSRVEGPRCLAIEADFPQAPEFLRHLRGTSRTAVCIGTRLSFPSPTIHYSFLVIKRI